VNAVCVPAGAIFCQHCNDPFRLPALAVPCPSAVHMHATAVLLWLSFIGASSPLCSLFSMYYYIFIYYLFSLMLQLDGKHTLTYLSAGYVTLAPLKHSHFDSYPGYLVHAVLSLCYVFSLYTTCLHTKRLFACGFRDLNVKRQHHQQQRK
jgi:hypothetical protein